MHSVRSRSELSFLLLLFVMAFLAASPLYASTLVGVVVDPDGRPVPGARVLVARASTIAASATTDAQGEFRLDRIDHGLYEVHVALEGFRAAPVSVAVAPDQTQRVTVQLQLSAISESIVVSAAQVEVPLSRTSDSITVLGRTELQARQIETVADALRLVPGLSIVRNGGRGAITSLFPRGGESDFTMVLVDGVRANTFGGGYDFSRLSVADVDRIEIVRGPQSALFGSDAIGGVVQIVTKHGGRPRLDATLEGGSEKTSRLAVSSAGSLGAWSWGAGAERRASDGFAGVAPATGEHVTNDDMAARHASASAAWHARRGAELRADVSYAWNDRGFPGPFGTNPIGAYTAVDRLSRGTTSTLGTGVRFAVPLTHGERPVRQRVQVNYADFASDYTSAFGLSRAETRRISARTQTDATLARGVRLSAGAELTGERALSTFITGDDPTPLPVRRRVIGAFVETEMTRLERVALTMGLRAEHIRRDRLEANLVGFSPRPAFGVDSLVSVNPKVTAAYSLYDRPVTRRGWHAGAVVPSSLRLRAAAGTGIRPPDALEIAFTDNPSLKPERSRSGEAGVEAGLAGGVTRVSATAFFNHYDDLIVAVGPDFRDASRFRTDNISNAQARGLELAARTRTSWGLDANFTYTWLHSAILAVDRGQGRAPAPFRPGDPLLRRPRHQGSVDIALTRGRTTSFVQIGARGRALDVEPTFGTFGGLFTNPGYLVAHAGTAVRITRMLDLFARVGNVTNRRYEETLGFPAPGRTVMVGVRFAASR